MGIPGLWSTTLGEGVTVAVLDSGVATSKVLPASRVDCFDSEGRASASITNEHGTLCAALIAANGKRVKGVAPKARIASFEVTLVDGVVSPVRVESALRQAVARGADVIACAFTLEQCQQSVLSAFESVVDSGIPVFGAADPTGASPPFPDSVDGVIIVGPQGAGSEVLHGTDISPRVDLLAPGQDLLTLRRNGTPTVWQASRTSGATALATGVGALLVSLVDGAARRKLGRELRDILVAEGASLAGSSRTKVLDSARAMAAVRARHGIGS